MALEVQILEFYPKKWILRPLYLLKSYSSYCSLNLSKRRANILFFLPL